MARRLAEVAKKVGVSEATVSRVLNGKPGVSEATRQAVLTALDVLGYERPTQLRGERARLVGLVLPELSNPIFPAFAEVVGGALAQHGLTSVLCTQTSGAVSEADYVALLLHQQVSGVIFFGGRYAEAEAPHDHYDLLTERNLPTVLLNAAIDSVRPGGVVAYVTCSPHLAETRDVVTAVAGSRDDVTILDAPAVLPEVPDLRVPERDNPENLRFAQFWPHRHGTDAIFLALLRRG